MRIKLTEKMIQNQILSYLRTIGIYCWKHWQGPMSSFKGVSDILGIMKNGKFIAIEVKTDRGIVTPEQQKFLDIISDNNGVAFLAKSLDEVMQKIKLRTKPQQNLSAYHCPPHLNGLSLIGFGDESNICFLEND